MGQQVGMGSCCLVIRSLMGNRRWVVGIVEHVNQLSIGSLVPWRPMQPNGLNVESALVVDPRLSVEWVAGWPFALFPLLVYCPGFISIGSSLLLVRSGQR